MSLLAATLSYLAPWTSMIASLTPLLAYLLCTTVGRHIRNHLTASLEQLLNDRQQRQRMTRVEAFTFPRTEDARARRELDRMDARLDALVAEQRTMMLDLRLAARLAFVDRMTPGEWHGPEQDRSMEHLTRTIQSWEVWMTRAQATCRDVEESIRRRSGLRE